MNYTFLSGGTGTPKLLEGFREIVDDSKLSIICNTGDDLSWYGLHVSPDLDTVLYLFSDQLDLEKYWGLKDETFHTLSFMRNLGTETWFNIGDKDLGLHIYRNNLLKDHTLTEVTKMILQQWNVSANILPMGDEDLRSVIVTDQGELSFQEYFVKYRWQPSVERVVFMGNKEQKSEEVENTLETTDSIILGPSNPVTSIGPIFAIDHINQAIKRNKSKTIAISPIVGEKAYSGPSVKLMKANSIETSVIGLAKHYKDHISKFVIAPQDKHLCNEIEDFGIEPIVLPIILNSIEEKKDLANSLMEIV